MNLENDLRRALHRQSPPAGFADRVLARIEREKPASRPVWWRAVAASVALAALLAGYTTHKIVERERGIRAKQEVLVAMHIAGEKVRYARHAVHEIGSHD
jgi:hypothetical protein